MKNIRNYLFICRSNQVRSPWASYWFSNYLKKQNIEAKVESAGLDVSEKNRRYMDDCETPSLQLTERLANQADKTVAKEEKKATRLDSETKAKRRLTEDYSRAVQGLQSIDNAINIYKKNPSVASLSGVPGRSFGIGESGKFETDMKNAQDILMRIRTGAAISMKESGLYDKIIDPKWYNDPKNRLNKMESLKNVYLEMVKRIEDPYRTPVLIQDIINKSTGSSGITQGVTKSGLKYSIK